MITKNYDLQTFKKSSSRLSTTLKSKGITVPKTTLLESLSHFFGFKDWNVLKAQLESIPSQKITLDNNVLLFSDEKIKSITDYFEAKRKDIISILEGVSDKTCLLAWRNQYLIKFYKIILDNMTLLNIKRNTSAIRKSDKKNIDNPHYYCYQYRLKTLEDERENFDCFCFVYNIALLLKEHFETYFQIILIGSREPITKDLGYHIKKFHFKIDYKNGWDAHYLRLYIETLFNDLRVIFPDY